ncbi:MAG: 50S ribosomal protein L21 [Candidatus Zambryskibacteria bacterium RIFCSPLOWO2_01_FULL_45_43]|uniref:Large ribosomal subunit protein bL21 n=2 Tax=Parcubacteria group TaxID=1794811 RepID=A0A1G1ZVM1_9BACT|nr:MAG: 50S ribosomal protein L21 [Candidatus Harrisonbacteria bacterium RIFCSPLOWO2_02_FULL_45_10c]OHB06227.1 MAG: 50S ribosomal protein L21 [Candidatus Zambryskibacteria bacterium RIFCSPLOWO2_01_FULL_45_43]
MAFAVIETGGKQYKVTPGQKLHVETLAGEKDASVSFDKVLLVADGEEVKVGAPYVSGARVEAKITGSGREDKRIVFKYHSKTRYKKKKGHRQHYTELEIISVK